MLHRLGRAFGVLFVLTCLSPDARAGKAGNEFQVNTTTAQDQRAPSVAALSGGDFVITWSSDSQDGSSGGVYGQLYRATGALVGGEFRVNTTTADDQRNPSVAALGGGGFVVTWESNNQDGSGYGVYGQRYTAAAAPVGGEFLVNTTTAGDQMAPSVAGLSDGGFVVTWHSFGQDGSPASWGVYGQRYDAAGALAGGELLVNTTTVNDQWYPSVAGLRFGGFVVTWQSFVPGGSLNEIYAQRYTAAGARVGGEFRVNYGRLRDQMFPSVAGLTVNGGFVITWNSFGEDDPSPLSWGVYAQRYSAVGSRLGAQFRVNAMQPNGQLLPAVANLSDGGFVVTWTSRFQDGSGNGVYGTRYSAAGARVGGEFQVNTFAANDQQYASVAGLSGGGFIVSWESNNQDGSGLGIYYQRYGP